MAVHSLRLYRIVSVLGPILLLGTGLFQIACGGLKKVEGKGTDAAVAASANPSLFTVPQEQLPHLRIVPVRRTSWVVSVRTTGTVDWDADHTTQAITQSWNNMYFTKNPKYNCANTGSARCAGPR